MRSDRPPARAENILRRIGKRCWRVGAGSTGIVVFALLLVIAVGILRSGVLVAFYPMPGDLTRSHGPVTSRASGGSCFDCHGLGGITSGCLDCHDEIEAQLEEERGLHGHFLSARGSLECAHCHLEHTGADHSLIRDDSWGDLDPQEFDHPHVEFHLEGKHESLECGQCHDAKLPAPIALSRFPDLDAQIDDA